MKKMGDIIVKWYQENRRELPWRGDLDPYHVWVSEIMLQQTRIEAVLSYYDRFMRSLPTIQDLANVEEEKLLKLWEGLGYYNRARNLKRAALQIMEKYHGIFPSTYEEILSLPGIGEYTASAIGSICFSLPEVTIDGNVLRVYTRVFEDSRIIDFEKERKKIRAHLMEIAPKKVGYFNEGLMELGETICLPNGMPKCEICPLKDLCLSRKHGTVLEYPHRLPKKEKKIEHRTVFIFFSQDHFLIEKREEIGVLHGLWQFPNTNQLLTKEDALEYCKLKGLSKVKIEEGISYTHIFTHKKWIMNSYFIEIQACDLKKFSGIFVTEEDLVDMYSLPSAFQPFRVAFYQRRSFYDEA